MMTPEDMEAQRLARDRLTVTMDEIGPVRWTEALLALAESPAGRWRLSGPAAG